MEDSIRDGYIDISSAIRTTFLDEMNYDNRYSSISKSLPSIPAAIVQSCFNAQGRWEQIPWSVGWLISPQSKFWEWNKGH